MGLGRLLLGSRGGLQKSSYSSSFKKQLLFCQYFEWTYWSQCHFPPLECPWRYRLLLAEENSSRYHRENGSVQFWDHPANMKHFQEQIRVKEMATTESRTNWWCELWGKVVYEKVAGLHLLWKQKEAAKWIVDTNLVPKQTNKRYNKQANKQGIAQGMYIS